MKTEREQGISFNQRIIIYLKCSWSVNYTCQHYIWANSAFLTKKYLIQLI